MLSRRTALKKINLELKPAGLRVRAYPQRGRWAAAVGEFYEFSIKTKRLTIANVDLEEWLFDLGLYPRDKHIEVV